MKKIIFRMFCICLFTGFSFAQTSSETDCALINNSRDAFFIEYERVEEKQNDKEKKKRSIILRLRNNSTCAIRVISSDTDYFLEKLPPTPNVEQVIKRKFRTGLVDGEFVPGFDFYTEFAFYQDLYVSKNNNGGDYKAALFLKGGDSLLFSVPSENFKKKMLVLVPFEFEWETKTGKFKYGGDTHHLIWFSYRKLPEEILKEIQK